MKLASGALRYDPQTFATSILAKRLVKLLSIQTDGGAPQEEPCDNLETFYSATSLARGECGEQIAVK